MVILWLKWGWRYLDDACLSRFCYMMASRPSRKIGFRSATISRWGDLETLARVARVEASAWYRSRCAGRAISDRRPQLPLVLSGGKICGTAALKAPVVNPDATPGNAVVDEVGLAAVQAVDGERRVSTSTRLPNARSPYAAISDADTLKAEVSAAPALLDDITDMGRRSAAEYVRLRRWRVEHLRSKADVFARSLDFCPEGYPVAVRAVLVCTLSAVYLADLVPDFETARLRAAEQNIHFSAFPLRGRFGWRRRAHWLGLL